MPSPLTQDQFFVELQRLFDQGQGKSHGAVYLTQKRYTHNNEDTPMPSSDNPFPDLHPTEPQSLIIHATNGKSKRDRASKVKISTIVRPRELEGFYTRYADVCKTGMTALKPRDRSKKKEKQKAKKKKTAAAATA